MILTYVMARATGLTQSEIDYRLHDEIMDKITAVSLVGVKVCVNETEQDITGVGDNKFSALMDLSSKVLRAKDKGGLKIAPSVPAVGAISP